MNLQKQQFNIEAEEARVEQSVQADQAVIHIWNSDFEIKFRGATLTDFGYFPASRVKITVELEQIDPTYTGERSAPVVHTFETSREANYDEQSDKKKAQGIHQSQIPGMDNVKISGVGAMECESIQVVKTFKPGEVFQSHGWEGNPENEMQDKGHRFDEGGICTRCETKRTSTNDAENCPRFEGIMGKEINDPDSPAPTDMPYIRNFTRKSSLRRHDLSRITTTSNDLTLLDD